MLQVGETGIEEEEEEEEEEEKEKEEEEEEGAMKRYKNVEV
jgi:hypothetical protein